MKKHLDNPTLDFFVGCTGPLNVRLKERDLIGSHRIHAIRSAPMRQRDSLIQTEETMLPRSRP